jgi:hypothetical protein
MPPVADGIRAPRWYFYVKIILLWCYNPIGLYLATESDQAGGVSR